MCKYQRDKQQTISSWLDPSNCSVKVVGEPTLHLTAKSRVAMYCINCMNIYQEHYGKAVKTSIVRSGLWNELAPQKQRVDNHFYVYIACEYSN